MGDVGAFAVLVLICAVVGLLAVLSNRLSERIHVPAPALFLVAARCEHFAGSLAIRREVRCRWGSATNRSCQLEPEYVRARLVSPARSFQPRVAPTGEISS